ncbi:hypothetical protein H6B14_13820 [Phocaeicola coprophilus]|nr:hypothetical protein [Phocaeicola coprophilus]
MAKHGFRIYEDDDYDPHEIGYNILGLLAFGAIGGPLVLLWRLIEKIMAWLE